MTNFFLSTLLAVAEVFHVSLAEISIASTKATQNSDRLKELVLEWEAAYVDCDVERLLPMHHPDSLLEIPGSEQMPAGGKFSGREALKHHLEEVFQVFRVERVIERYIDVAENVVFHRPLAVMHTVPTNQRFEARFLNEIEFQDDLIVRRMVLVDLSKYQQSMKPLE